MTDHTLHIELKSELLQKIGALADTKDVNVFVVGGYIRDYLLGKEVNDIDILVIGDGIEFAKHAAAALHRKKVVTYEKFGTAMLYLDPVKIEFVGARKESYAKDSRNPLPPGFYDQHNCSVAEQK
jgi:poly(A) polymerase